MANNELISVIVPVYKVEPYLNRCIDSLLSQTYERLEIILVNDGSPDSCPQICDEYAKKDSRIKVIHKENGGLSSARNTGIEIALGRYISFLDSDDWVDKEYIATLYKLLLDTDSDISACDFLRTATESVPAPEKGVVYQFSNIEALYQFTSEFYVQMVVTWGKLYKIELFDHIRFPLGRLHEDEFTTYKLIYEAKKLVLTTSKLLYYWQREDSIMRSGFDLAQRLDALDSYEERSAFFQFVGLNELSNKTDVMEFDLCLSYLDETMEFEDKSSQDILIERLGKIKTALISKELHIEAEDLKHAKAYGTVLLEEYFDPIK